MTHRRTSKLTLPSIRCRYPLRKRFHDRGEGALDKECRKLSNEVGRGPSCEWRWIMESCILMSNDLTCMYRVEADQLKSDHFQS
jgi:hypothetical protein